MKIENLVRITGGVLLNTPSVTSITNIQIESCKVSSGSLFIDTNQDENEINEAIKNGAYAILCSNSNITDNEIAWITTQNLNLSIVKLARFYTIKKNLNFIPLETIQYSLIKSLHVKGIITSFLNKPQIALIQILNSKENETFFVLENPFIDMIDPTIKRPLKKVAPSRLTSKGLFFSSFVCEDLYIKDLKLPAFFVPYLCALIKYLKEKNINFTYDNFSNFKHFYAIFINDAMEKKEFGSTSKAVILENNLNLFEKELNFLEKKIAPNCFNIFIPKEIKKKIKTKATKITYENFTEIKQFENKKFRYILAYVKQDSYENLFFQNKDRQMLLF